MSFDLHAFMREWRAARPDAIPDGKVIKQPELDLILSVIAGTWVPGTRPPLAPAAPAADPPWVAAGRAKIGEREVTGAKHNPWIIGFWSKLGAPWIKTDDSDGAWCGGFVAWCLNEAGLPYPKNYPAASSFATWGTACKAQLGAIGVKSRDGGNHVFQIVGETADGVWFLCLGGNQDNQVSIIAIRKAEVKFIQWPKGAGTPPDRRLPVLPKATVARSEG